MLRRATAGSTAARNGSKIRAGRPDNARSNETVQEQALGLGQIPDVLGVAAEAAAHPGLAAATGDHRSAGGRGSAVRQGAGPPGRCTTVRPLSPSAAADEG